MVTAVRCPAAKCRKYMLVEDADRGRVVACLVCKAAVQVPAGTGAAARPAELEISDADPGGLPVARPLPPA